MKRGKISIGTIAFFVAIGVFRGCQDYNLEHQNQPAQRIKKQLEQIDFDDYFIPAEKDNIKDLQITYKK